MSTHRHGQIPAALCQAKAVLFAAPALQRGEEEEKKKKVGGREPESDIMQNRQGNGMLATVLKDRFIRVN